MKNFLSFVFSRKVSIIFLIFLVALGSLVESISFSSLPIALRVILNSQEPPKLFSNVESLKFLDNLINDLFFKVEPHLAIIRIAILTFFIFLIKFLVLFLKDVITTIVEEKMMMEIRNKMFSKLLSLPTYWINTHSSGEIISRFTNDIRLLKGSLTEGIFEFLFSLVKLIIYISILIVIALNLLLFGILIAIPLGLMLFLISKAMNYRWNKLNQNISQMGSYIGSIVRGIKVIKIFSSRNNEISKFEKLSKNYFNAVLKLEALGSFSSNFSEFIVSIPIILFLVYVSNLVFLKSQLTSDQFIVFLLLVISSISPIKRIFKANNHIQRGVSIYNRILEFLNLPDEPRGGNIKFEKLKEKIELVNVSFYYGNKIILDNISFTIEKGEKIGIVGLSGAGKTTLIEILSGLLKPSLGKVLIDGIDLWDYDIESYRSKISFVPQEPFLFEGTIYENLTFSKNISLEEVKKACNLANIDEFIESLENGYFYKLSEGGTNLSGGQRQRLTIARAILRNPEIIFLDEPTSNLDAQSEEKIINAIENFLFDKTAIIIAHRISTILFVDKIIVMKNGRILDIGKHEELLQRCEFYRNLVEVQTIG
ncbi:MAG: ABC transporter ATP-binding protein [Candidatus Hydrothermia bacterium]|jgi:ABC-type multidrug transport system fused ATPase/permease subunit|nr:ABC transporter ATP-binding protein [Candidatus Hydrothermia bacterium]